jgi:DNA-binding NarL/FixJ family response regulator
MSCFEATRQIRKARPETKVLFLTMYDDEDYLVEGMEVGASGYVLKDSPAPQLASAVRDVNRGGSYLSPKCCRSLSTIPQPGEGQYPHSAIFDSDAAGARSAEAAGGRQFGEGNRRDSETSSSRPSKHISST